MFPNSYNNQILFTHHTKCCTCTNSPSANEFSLGLLIKKIERDKKTMLSRLPDGSWFNCQPVPFFLPISSFNL